MLHFGLRHLWSWEAGLKSLKPGNIFIAGFNVIAEQSFRQTALLFAHFDDIGQ
jgi:hypothetical protein